MMARGGPRDETGCRHRCLYRPTFRWSAGFKSFLGRWLAPSREGRNAWRRNGAKREEEGEERDEE
jgi:hypothetical protein